MTVFPHSCLPKKLASSPSNSASVMIDRQPVFLKPPPAAAVFREVRSLSTSGETRRIFLPRIFPRRQTPSRRFRSCYSQRFASSASAAENILQRPQSFGSATLPSPLLRAGLFHPARWQEFRKFSHAGLHHRAPAQNLAGVPLPAPVLLGPARSSGRSTAWRSSRHQR